MGPKIQPLAEALADRILQGQEDDACWIWTGYKNTYGYGQFYLDGRYQPAHRVMYSLANGPIPEGLFVLHRCDNPPCVNPHHLFLGTQADNMADCKAKGRNAFGERSASARFTEQDIREIRNSNQRPSDLARKFGTTYRTIRKIITGQRWRHLQ